MNALCGSCKVRTVYSGFNNEYYCPKCGLVVQGFNLVPAYDPERNPGVMPWRSNLQQTMPVEKWVGNRVYIKGMTTK